MKFCENFLGLNIFQQLLPRYLRAGNEGAIMKGETRSLPLKRKDTVSKIRLQTRLEIWNKRWRHGKVGKTD